MYLLRICSSEINLSEAFQSGKKKFPNYFISLKNRDESLGGTGC